MVESKSPTIYALNQFFFSLLFMIPPSLWRLRCLFTAGVAQRFSLLYSGSSFMRFRIYTQRRNTVGRTSLDEGPACRRDLYLTTHNTHNRQTSMPPAGFEPTIPSGERSSTYALDRAATGTGPLNQCPKIVQVTCTPQKPTEMSSSQCGYISVR